MEDSTDSVSARRTWLGAATAGLLAILGALALHQPPSTIGLLDDLSRWLQPAVPAPVLEDRVWAQQFYGSIKPTCSKFGKSLPNTTRPYDGPPVPRTVLITYPRSGNTLSRQLVERATGYRTSSVYCDKSLEQTFAGECSNGTGSLFLQKSHYPALWGRGNATEESKNLDYDRGIQIVRNPLDAIFSFWQWRNFEDEGMKVGKAQHERHVPVDALGSTAKQLQNVTEMARSWRDFHAFWDDATLPKLVVRYEDLRSSPLPPLLQMIQFLLPLSRLPSLSDVVCALVLDPSREAYKSRKAPTFNSWNKWDPAARKAVLEITREGWCRHGYDQSHNEVFGSKAEAPIDCRDVLRKAALASMARPPSLLPR